MALVSDAWALPRDLTSAGAVRYATEPACCSPVHSEVEDAPVRGGHSERRFGALAIANTASGTHVEIAMESAYRAHGELEARDRMVDARAIAYMIPCGRPRGPAVRDQVRPSLIMINGVHQCPGRDMITIRKETVRKWALRCRA